MTRTAGVEPVPARKAVPAPSGPDLDDLCPDCCVPMAPIGYEDRTLHLVCAQCGSERYEKLAVSRAGSEPTDGC
jgi:hypothetical protein